MMPFPGGIEAPANATLIFALAASALYLAMLQRPPSWRRTLAKAGSIALLAVLVGIERGPVLLAVALALSAAGDAALAQEKKRSFLLGLVAFLAAHLVYVALFWIARDGAPSYWADPWRFAGAIVLAGSTIAMWMRLRLSLPAGMQLPVAIYVLTILAMGLSALTLPMPLVIVGAVAFIASDALLAAGKFLVAPQDRRQPAIRIAVWLLYYAAQAMIALGFLLD